MFLVNKLLGINRAPNPELITIDGGSLHLVRPDTLKSSRGCIFIDASISIRRTTHEFHYQLVVTRTFEEGEEQLLEEDAENSDERAFLLDPSLSFCLGPTLDPSSPTPPALSFTWLDPDAEDDEFEFILPVGSGAGGVDVAEQFEKLSWRCQWERENSRNWPTDVNEAKRVEATLPDLYRVERSQLSQSPLFRPTSPSSDSEDEDQERYLPLDAPSPAPRREDEEDDGDDSGDELAAALTSRAVITSPPAREPVASTSTIDKVKGPQRINAIPKSSTLRLAVPCQLFLFDKPTGVFMTLDERVQAEIHEVDGGFWLMVRGEERIWVSQGILNESTINFSDEMTSMVFNFHYEPPTSSSSTEMTETFTWLLRFVDDEESYEKMQLGIATAKFEGVNGAGTWKKLSEPDRRYIKNAYTEDAEMYGINEDEEKEADARADEAEQRRLEDEEEDDDFAEEAPSDDERESFAPKQNKAKNSQLAVGYKEDLSFVVQGDMIGVFKAQRDGGKKLKFVTSIVNLSTPDGKKAFTPSKIMLHDQDTSMILQNPLNKGALYRLDLETGVVVDEYKVSQDFAISNFIPDSKFAQTTQQQTFIGLSHNGVFRIDPRLNGDKLVDSEFKQYVSKNDFSAAATTESGRLAVASNKGDIRLFDKLGKNAKTVIPAIGDPILGMDVSADGRWALATCKTYLLLIDTLIPEGAGRYGGSSGFDRSFPADQKPKPKRMQLRPEHVAYMEEQSKEGVSFTPAKFNAGPNEVERTIVTSTGPFVVAWNFRHVKAGNTANYTLRRFSDIVIADQFKFGGDRDIIVTLPGNVFVEDKKKLKAPTRDSISTIVQTWD